MKRLFFVALLGIVLTVQLLYAQGEPGSFEFEGRYRYYEVFLPQNPQPSMPVVITLHGYLDSIELIKTSNMHEVGDTTGFITVYPHSASVAWNTGETNPPPYGWPKYDETVNDVGFISALIDTLDSQFDIDLNRIYVCGLSSGGMMTYRLANEIGYRFAAVASICGPLNEVTASNRPNCPFPVLHMHGTAGGVELVEIVFEGDGPGTQACNYQKG